MLGYTEVSAFSHAFRRWSGRPPRAVRSQRRKPAPPAPAKLRAALMRRLTPRFGTPKQVFVPQIASFCRQSALREAHTNGVPEFDRDPHEINLSITYLREIAQTCTRLARTCPHQATSHGLEEIAVDLMAKAQELERHYDRVSAEAAPIGQRPPLISVSPQTAQARPRAIPRAWPPDGASAFRQRPQSRPAACARAAVRTPASARGTSRPSISGRSRQAADWQCPDADLERDQPGANNQTAQHFERYSAAILKLRPVRAKTSSSNCRPPIVRDGKATG